MRLKVKQNTAESDMRALGVTIERLESARSQIQLPAGTQAETEQQIISIRLELANARDALQSAKIEKARIETEEKTAAKTEIDKEKIRQEMEEKRARMKGAPSPEQTVVNDPLPQNAPAPNPLMPANPSERQEAFLSFSAFEEAEMSIRSILATMERVGCTSCAAILVCKRELKKFRKGTVA